MKQVCNLLKIGAVSAVLTLSAAHAQPSAPSDNARPLTRADVKADLVEWRNAGFNPQSWVADPSYFAAIAQRVAERRQQQAVTQ